MLAAGAGTRLRPLTRLRPKALCPVGNVALVDLALGRLARVTSSVAVNVHHGRDQLEGHVAGRAHLSVEETQPLGTAGALGRLRDWIAGRPVLVTNADAWLPGIDLRSLVSDWDGRRLRLLAVPDVARPDFAGRWRYAGVALLPWAEVRTLPERPVGLYERSWRPAEIEGRLDLVAHAGRFVDCGTPADYLAANLGASGGRPVVGEGAVVRGRVVRSVVWPGSVVHQREVLVDAIRAGPLTVLVR